MSLAYLSRRKLQESSNNKSIYPFPILGAFGRCVDYSEIRDDNIDKIAEQVIKIYEVWPKFEEWASSQDHNTEYVVNSKLNDNYYKGKNVDDDIDKYFSDNPIQIEYS